jgi:hypothetical protein
MANNKGPEEDCLDKWNIIKWNIKLSHQWIIVTVMKLTQYLEHTAKI